RRAPCPRDAHGGPCPRPCLDDHGSGHWPPWRFRPGWADGRGSQGLRETTTLPPGGDHRRASDPRPGWGSPPPSRAEMGLVMRKGYRGRRFEDLDRASALLLHAGGRAGRADRIASREVVAEEGVVAFHVPDARAQRDAEHLALLE